MLNKDMKTEEQVSNYHDKDKDCRILPTATSMALCENS